MDIVNWWITHSNLPAVIQIDHECFGPQCWSEYDFLWLLRKHDCFGRVAMHNEMVVGYMLYELRRRRVYVSRIAVSPAARRMRVGSRLLEAVLQKLIAAHQSEVIVRVPDGNVATQLFCRANGLLCYEIEDDDYLFRATADSVASKVT